MSNERPPDRLDLERLYQRYGTFVFRRARRLLGDEQLARDVSQDVFLSILRAPDWNPPSPVGWLCTTTTNCCLNLLRKKRRWRDLLRARPLPPVAAPSLPIAALLEGVPARLQEIAVYYGLDEMTQDEIALVLGISQKTVSNRLQELRALLDERPPAAVEVK
jgi:DNA-directed RNA polymerase specialized sigma24 family protein